MNSGFVIDRGDHPNGKLVRSVWQHLSATLQRKWWAQTQFGDHPENATAGFMFTIKAIADVQATQPKA
jgi:hypothetical protein